MGTTFVEKYPSLARWVREDGRIEIGYVERSDTFARAIMNGIISWKGEADYRTIDEALKDMERGVKEYLETKGITVRKSGKKDSSKRSVTKPRKPGVGSGNDRQEASRRPRKPTSKSRTGQQL